MSWLLSVDPDVEAPGLALFVEGRLVAAGRCRCPSTAMRDLTHTVGLGKAAREWVRRWESPIAEMVDADSRKARVLVEWPRVYRAGTAKRGADPNDLLDIAAVGAVIAAAFPLASHERVEPRDWKGTIPKPKKAGDPYIVEERILERLSPAEREVWARDAAGLAPTPRLEVTDAVGIGLHGLGRGIVNARHRVIAR